MTFFRSRGYTGTYNDAFRKYLVDLTGNTVGTIDDLLSKVLSSYSGSVADKILSFGRDRNYLGTFNDVVTQIWLGGGFQWIPSALGSGLALWLDAADARTITLNGSTVSKWNDKSGNNRNVSQATASLQPTYSATGMLGRPTLDWGTDVNNKSLINATNFSNFSPTRFFVVADYDGPNPATDYFGLLRPNFTSTIDYVALLNIHTLDWLANAQFLNGAATASLSAAPILQPFILATSTACSPNRTNLRVGADDDPNRGWRGKISEVIAINFVPTTQERNLIEGYLAWKWDLVANLPAGHPFKNTPPTL